MRKQQDTLIGITEHLYGQLSIQPSVKTRFAMFWLTRVFGVSRTEIAERAILHMLKNDKRYQIDGKPWEDYWDESPGVAMCKLFLLDEAMLEPDEIIVKAFVL